ncbi:LamB/YcsF family protein [Thiomicrospira microaerophila]|uniref:5-oxoprolinase subunit PxpA n=1 Tax=Thiomicrospira microaerophila TaxID=406020 RepID=UPI00200CE5A4|nr:5-oxoprolinase subunit PxpA [Thiomicrospira microaerophila]UQB41283.1 LamB/YcsF family protein [Thiomicrospira microaerophila]
MPFINADVGESYHHWTIGQDQALIPLVDAVNIATGFHAGDPLTLETTLKLAKQQGCKIAAHPGYADLIGFGRRSLPYEANKLNAELRYQLGAFKIMAEHLGLKVDYIKPHGALYHDLLTNQNIFNCLVDVVQSLFPTRPIMVAALPSPHPLDPLAKQRNQPLLKEGFLDRHYQPNGQLIPRQQANALITDTKQVIARYKLYQTEGIIQTQQQTALTLKIDSWCLHGDQPHALDFAKAIKTECNQHD